jgi:hypothetical protein
VRETELTAVRKLALSLVGTAESDQHPAAAGVIIRLARAAARRCSSQCRRA